MSTRFNPYPILICQLLIFILAIYLGIAWATFQWRNPLANRMCFYRDFGAVVRFEKMPEYQSQK